MRLFGFNLLSDRALEKAKREAMRNDRAGIKHDIMYMSEHQAEIGKMNGNRPCHNGWNGISVRYACALVTQRQENEDEFFKK